MSMREHLLRPDVWPVPVDQVGYLETHISELFFVGDRVYKVKKAVDLGFLDFRSLEARRFYCEEELRLNRRLSPDVYLGIRDIRQGADGRFRVGGSGRLVDHAVEMRRLPAHRMLDRLLDLGDLDNSMMRALASVLHRFHESAEQSDSIDRWGSPEAVRRNAIENLDQVRPGTGSADVCVISETQHAWLRGWLESFLEDHDDLLQRRVSEGRIRDCHGDLHAGNICFPEDEGEDAIRIYDCLEFAPRYRQCDVACDLSFLLMDLDARGYRAFASFLCHEYLAESADLEFPVLVPFYKCYRACVRAKIAWFRSGQLSGQAAEVAREESRAYFQLALSYSLPPSLILVCGLPASGKTVAARSIARPFEARVVSSDRVRKRQHGLQPRARTDSPLGEGLYTPRDSDEVYRELLQEAGDSLSDGRVVVVDAGFRQVLQRRPFLELARRLGLSFVVLHLEVSQAATRQRLELRSRDRDAESEADWSVYSALASRFELPQEIPRHQRVVANGELAASALTSLVLDSLVEQASLDARSSAPRRKSRRRS